MCIGSYLKACTLHVYRDFLALLLEICEGVHLEMLEFSSMNVLLIKEQS